MEVLSFLLVAIAVLACPIGMWLMMRFCMKGKDGDNGCDMGGHKSSKGDQKSTETQEPVMSPAQPAAQDTVAALQAKVEALERELSMLRATAAERDEKAEDFMETVEPATHKERIDP